MRRDVLTRAILSALFVTALTLACEQPATNNPTGPSAAGPSSLELVGPSSVEPGQSAQLSTSFHFPDGTVKNGSDVIWRSSNASVLQITQSGLVTALAPSGESTITAQASGGRSVSRELVVLPAGTFRMVGQVTESGSQSFPVINARVEAASGSPSTTADTGGRYRLYGVPPAADIRVSAPGYNEQTFPIQLAANSTRNFTLGLSGPRANLSGNYTLFIDAPSCPGTQPVPADLQHRSYLVAITQTGAVLSVKLTEPRFNLKTTGPSPIGNTFSGTVLGSGASFSLAAYGAYIYFTYISYPNVVELLPDGRSLVVQGDVIVTGSSAGMSGTMTNSALLLFGQGFPGNTLVTGQCSTGLQFRLEPR